MPIEEYVADIFVDNEKGNISFGKIKTRSVATCHFFLFYGRINEEPFSFLWHTSKDFQEPEYNAATTIVKILQIVSKLMGSKLEQNSKNIDQITELNLFAGGGVPLEPDLIQMGLSILNDQQLHIDQLLTSTSTKHLYQHLKYKLKTIPPITSFLADNEEEKGRFSFNLVVRHMNQSAPYSHHHKHPYKIT